jgi:hypothetical protein
MSLFVGYLLGKKPIVIEYQYLFTIIPILGLLAVLGFRKSIS